jgi:hypothetical protein
MSGEVSYFSHFFVKFVEIIAAGLASAISAYLLAHFVSSPTPASPPTVTAVQVAPNSSGVAAQPAPPAAAAAASEHPAPQDAAEPKLVPKASKDANVLSPRKHPKTDTDVAEKEARSQKSAKALVRAALANVDAKAPADAVIGPGTTDTRSAPVDAQPRQANMPLRQADVGPRPIDVPPLVAAIKTPANAAGGDMQPPSPDVRPSPVTSVEIGATSGRRRRPAAAECQPAA